MNIGLAGIVKDEAQYLLEWIAFHRIVGVDSFFIADNGSTDGTRELLGSLAEMPGFHVIDVPTIGGQRPQLPAYEQLVKLSSQRGCDIVAFVDADEFLVPLDGATSIRPFLNGIFSDSTVSCLSLNWACFGSAGQLFFEDGLVTKRFRRRAPQSFSVNKHYKSIVRPECVLRFKNPHHAVLTGGRHVDAAGADIKFDEKHGHGLSESTLWQGVRVNHYVVKSLEEFVVGKSRKGSASRADRVKHKAYFLLHDRNDEVGKFPEDLEEKIEKEVGVLAAAVSDSPNSKESSQNLYTNIRNMFLK